MNPDEKDYWFTCYMNERETHAANLKRYEAIVQDLNNQIESLKAERKYNA